MLYHMELYMKILKQFNYLFNYLSFKVDIHPSVPVRLENTEIIPYKPINGLIILLEVGTKSYIKVYSCEPLSIGLKEGDVV